MEITDTIVNFLKGKGEVSQEEYKAIVGEIDRTNIELLISEIKKHSEDQKIGAVVMLVGGILNRPGGYHKDIDIKISMKASFPATAAKEVLGKAIEALTKNHAFVVENKKENSRMVEKGFIETWLLTPNNNGIPIQIIPPYGQEDVSFEIDVKGMGRNRRFFKLAEL